MANGLMSIKLSTSATFGSGSIENIHRQAFVMQMQKPLIVSDPGVSDLGMVEKVSSVLEKNGLPCAVFDQCSEDPKTDDIMAGTDSYKANGCDGFIAIGGGSPMDAAKVMRLISKQGGDVSGYNLLTGGLAKIGWNLPPMIAIPTTAGTGSEVSLGALISDPVKKIKFIIGGASLAPEAAILDPELTLTMPPSITAATGFDALAHAIEAYTSQGLNPVGKMFAQASLELIGKSFEKAVQDGSNIEARSDMLQAAFYSGIAIMNGGLGGAHAMAHSLGGRFKIPHGIAVAIVMPHVMRRNQAAAGGKYLEIMRLMGKPCETPEAAAQRIAEMAAGMQIPLKLSDFKVEDDDIEALTQNTLTDFYLASNPVQLGRDDVSTLFKNAV